MSVSTLFFFSKMSLSICTLLQFHMNFRISFVQKSHLDFDRDCTDLYVDLGNNSILTIPYLLTHEHAMSFHLLKSSLIFLTIFYSFQYTSLVPPW